MLCVYIYIYVTGPQRPPLPPMVMVPPPPCGVVWWYGSCQSLMLYKGCMNRYKAYLSVGRSKKGSMKRWSLLDCNSVAKHLLPPVVVMCCWHSFEGRREGRRKKGREGERKEGKEKGRRERRKEEGKEEGRRERRRKDEGKSSSLGFGGWGGMPVPGPGTYINK